MVLTNGTFLYFSNHLPLKAEDFVVQCLAITAVAIVDFAVTASSSFGIVDDSEGNLSHRPLHENIEKSLTKHKKHVHSWS